uniref:(California timema) hypothetical protein n=1 Tax=Timema californicum TaxID=61474 RepID=A0A7R9J1Y5_TIMCA|nr:unnamed protein product [Timema californicum]
MQGRCCAQPEYRQSMSLVLVRSMTQYLESRQSLVPGWLRLYSACTRRIFPQQGAARIDDRDTCFHDRPHALLVLSLLFGGLMLLMVAGIMQLFLGSSVLELVISLAGAFLFALFIVYDTQMLMKTLSPEEYILATINLYLDIVNLFLYILRALKAVRSQ